MLLGIGALLTLHAWYVLKRIEVNLLKNNCGMPWLGTVLIKFYLECMCIIPTSEAIVLFYLS